MQREAFVERAGLQSLIVDRGRIGYRNQGVGWCGAADLLAFSVAQRLAGNTEEHAAIEIVMGDVIFTFEAPARFALAGADCNAELDGARISAWSSHQAKAGSRLVLHRPQTWMRTVLAIDGGIDVPRVLDSRTTDITAAMGGFAGRALRAGDRLALGATMAGAAVDGVRAPQEDFAADAFSRDVLPLRVLPEPGYENIWDRDWLVGHESNRMGCRLHGDAVPHAQGSIRSQGVFPGIVQVPPSGEPIVLLTDSQTTGGYPIAGVLIEADVWMLAQARIGAPVRLVPCTLDEAERASERIRDYVRGVEVAIGRA
jgi:5-oxoprolinase (ATP-hydrolysing) subunit C